ncbi:MAG: hypothetical protein CMP11_01140 [Zetaproteobacteria bacterium]|nr:hypothetical protein [Pseudobdellovibrionaceae bacterium]|tara:strand:- start:1370 stop:3319 length:1950 start_codon:yes stop_codon:yes gene_type:complete
MKNIILIHFFLYILIVPYNIDNEPFERTKRYFLEKPQDIINTEDLHYLRQKFNYFTKQNRFNNTAGKREKKVVSEIKKISEEIKVASENWLEKRNILSNMDDLAFYLSVLPLSTNPEVILQDILNSYDFNSKKTDLYDYFNSDNSIKPLIKLKKKIWNHHTEKNKLISIVGAKVLNTPLYLEELKLQSLINNEKVQEYEKTQENLKDKKIVIIGAGPIGLLTALQAIKIGLKVEIFEKRKAYSRNQVLILWPKTIQILKKIFGQRTFDNLSLNEYMTIKPSGYGTIGIKHLEMALATKLMQAIKASKHNHKFYRGTEVVTKNNKLFTQHNEKTKEIKADLIIGCDSFRTTVGKVLNISQNKVSTEAIVGIVGFSGVADYKIYSFFNDREGAALVSGKESYILLEISEKEYKTYINLNEKKRRSWLIDKALNGVANIKLKNKTELSQKESIKFLKKKILPGEINARAFPIFLTEADKVTGWVKNSSMVKTPAILAGDAVRTTHFLAGSGLNDAIINQLKEVKYVLNNLNKPMINVLSNYSKKIKKSVKKYHQEIFFFTKKKLKKSKFIETNKEKITDSSNKKNEEIKDFRSSLAQDKKQLDVSFESRRNLEKTLNTAYLKLLSLKNYMKCTLDHKAHESENKKNPCVLDK